MRLLLINLLLHLIESVKPRDNSLIDEEKMRWWLADCYPQKNFRDYIKKRDTEILQALGSGVNSKKYLTLLGQRIEIGRLFATSKQEFEKLEAKGRKKIKTKQLKEK